MLCPPLRGRKNTAGNPLVARPLLSLEGVSTTRERTMTKLKTIGVIGALLLGTSTLALAQTNAPTTGSGSNSGAMMRQPTSPPQGGSQPPMASPQNAPASRPMAGSSGSTVPGPQTARMTDQDVKKH